MGLHSEASLAKFPPFEIEMRRRLWWALALYDARIGEMVDYKNMGMSPTWDCKPPLNVNDSELWPDMKESPTVPIQSKPSEALFAVVRANIMNAVRYTSFYLDFTGFGLRGFDKKIELSDLETTIEDSFLRSCDPENPDHAMAVGMSRTAFARFRLMEHYSKQGGSSLNPSEAQRDAPIGFALSFLENDTKVIGSPRLKCYDWHQRLYFPLPGYIHLLYDLRMRPLGTNSARAWEAMGANYGARFRLLESADNPRFRSLANLVLVAWDARIAALSRGRGSNSSNSNSDKEAELAPLTPPRIVSDIRVARSSSLDNWGAEGGRAQEGRDTHLATAGGGLDDSSARRGNPELGMNNVPVGVFADSFQYGMDWQANFSAGLDVAGDTNVSQLNWSTLGWDLGGID